MAAITSLNTPHTNIENAIIANMAELGAYCFSVYCAIKMHVNQATGACFPSYATIARITGIHRSTVIECVKKLKALKLISPHWRFKEDGSHTSNQYDFQQAGSPAPAQKSEKVVKTVQGSRPEQPPLVAEDDHPSRPQRPEQSETNKKKLTIEEVDFMVTEKQRTCNHPENEVVRLSEGIVVCNHCYGLLDENFQLIEEKQPVEIVDAA